MSRQSDGIFVSPILYYIEKLSVFSWIKIFFYLASNRFSKKNSSHYQIYYIESSPPGLILAHLTLWIIPATLERLDFRLIDIKDEQGNLLILRIINSDFWEVENAIFQNPVFQEVLNDHTIKPRMSVYLKKSIASLTWYASAIVWRPLLLIHIVLCKTKEKKCDKAEIVLFMQKRIWQKEMGDYAAKYGVRILPVSNFFEVDAKTAIKILVGSQLRILRNIYFYILKEGIGKFFKDLPKIIRQRKSKEISVQDSQAHMAV